MNKKIFFRKIFYIDNSPQKEPLLEITYWGINHVTLHMFDKEFQTEDKNDETDAYFEVMKLTLDKSKIKAANASNRKITIETILENFPQIQGNLRMDNQVLKDVNMKKLYKYIEEHPETQTDKIYNIVVNFRRDNGLPEVQK